ncbi:Arm DNA-binding domain-containing protein [Sphingomonas sp. DT-51]|uniref:Arm DNA-binding domain-containing protein n=1 Tax=Sphingomonas sp. DT-51 TaxID=3396165 RepID=UPI003F1A5CC6
MPSGYRSWRWRYRLGGKEKLLTFAPVPEISLARARQLREDAARKLRANIDPSISKRQRVTADFAETQVPCERVTAVSQGRTQPG